MFISTVCSSTGKPDIVVKKCLRDVNAMEKAVVFQVLAIFANFCRKILHTAFWHAPPPHIRSNMDSKALKLWQNFKFSYLR